MIHFDFANRGKHIMKIIFSSMKNGVLSHFFPALVAGIVMFSLLQSEARAAASVPPGWPWRGVALEGTATAKDIKKLAGFGVNSVEIVLSPRSLSINQKLTPEQAWQFSLN